MNKINLENVNPFPADIEAWDFLQQMTLLVSAMGSMAGKNMILKGCESVSESKINSGIVILNGEILPFSGGNKEDYVRVEERTETVEYEGQELGLYKKRQLVFGNSSNTLWSSFSRLTLNDLLNGKQNAEAGKGLSSCDFTTAEKNKLATVSQNANNYAHPSSHDPSIITTDSHYRFVSDAEKAVWNSKADGGVSTVQGDDFFKKIVYGKEVMFSNRVVELASIDRARRHGRFLLAEIRIELNASLSADAVDIKVGDIQGEYADYFWQPFVVNMDTWFTGRFARISILKGGEVRLYLQKTDVQRSLQYNFSLIGLGGQ